MRKLTIEFVREQFEKEGYTLLSEAYVNNTTFLDYICPENHPGSIVWSSWQQGHRCATCAGLKKLTIEFIREEFEKENYTLVSDVYVNNKTPLEYICPNNHPGSIMWNCWRRGIRCAECVGLKRLTIEFIREQFKKEGYTFLAKEYVNNKQKLEYVCPKNHTNSIAWANWQNGQRCADCAGYKKLTIEFIKKEFESDRYILLTKEYKDANQKLKYMCPRGHKWSISWSKWKLGRRCPRCRALNMSGENHPRWDINLTDEERQSSRDYSEYNDWRTEVFKRDKYTCQICGYKGKKLVSHHLYSYDNNPDLRTSLENGVCLCEECHKAFHHKYGYGNNTKEQFEEFRCILWHTYCIYYMNKITGDIK